MPFSGEVGWDAEGCLYAEGLGVWCDQLTLGHPVCGPTVWYLVKLIMDSFSSLSILLP